MDAVAIVRFEYFAEYIFWIIHAETESLVAILAAGGSGFIGGSKTNHQRQSQQDEKINQWFHDLLFFGEKIRRKSPERINPPRLLHIHPKGLQAKGLQPIMTSIFGSYIFK
jgi:hypothetical protein